MNKVALIQSPSKFYEVVPIFYKLWNEFGFFDKFYIVTDYKGDYGVGTNCEIIQLKKDMEFCSNMIYALEQIKEEILFICCEDHVRKEGNDLTKWNYCFDQFCRSKSMGFLRLTNTKNKVPSAIGTSNSIFPINKKYRYYISLQPGFWRKEYFKCTLKDMGGKDAWKYERGGAKRARKHPTMSSFCVKDTVVFRTNFFRGGEFYRTQFVNYALSNNIKMDKKKKVYFEGKKITVDEYIRGANREH